MDFLKGRHIHDACGHVINLLHDDPDPAGTPFPALFAPAVRRLGQTRKQRERVFEDPKNERLNVNLYDIKQNQRVLN